jgi:hypothetical protein
MYYNTKHTWNVKEDMYGESNLIGYTWKDFFSKYMKVWNYQG